jgi:hypothetical protein
LAVFTGGGVATADTTDTDSSTKTSAYSSKKRDEKRDASESAGGSASAPSPSDTDTNGTDAGADDSDADDTGANDTDADDTDTDTDTDDVVKDDAPVKESIKNSSRRAHAAEKDAEPAQSDPEPEQAPEPRMRKAPTKVVADVYTEVTKTIAAVAAPAKTVEQIRTVTPETVTPPRRLVADMLTGLKISIPAPARPVAPPRSSLLLALAALGSRPETEARTLSTTTAPTATAAALAVPVPTAAVTTPVTTRVGWLTGANSINDTVRRFGIAGTDVGVMWDNGILKDNPATTIVEQRQVLIAFGDTFSGAGMTGIWRNNVLLRSADNVLSNGLYVPNGIIHDPGSYSGSPMTNPNFSREIIGKYGYAVGPEVTIIPTAAVSVPGAGANGATRQYVNFMSVRSWDTPGKWTTNYSGVIWSDDNGQNWTVVPASGIRPAAAGRSTRPFINGNQNFQQGAYVKPPAGSADAAAGWVYSYGTPAGRGGTVYVSRVNDKQILDQTKYEYWNGSSWVKNNPAAAKPILPGTTTTSFFGLVKNTTYPTAGEMSVQYNPYLKKYVMLYTDSGDNVVMRTSSTPQGTWSTPKTLATSSQYPGLYAPMIHPWSGSTMLRKADGTPEDPQMLYWNLSQWNEYNVALMRTDLSRV